MKSSEYDGRELLLRIGRRIVHSDHSITEKLVSSQVILTAIAVIDGRKKSHIILQEFSITLHLVKRLHEKDKQGAFSEWPEFRKVLET